MKKRSMAKLFEDNRFLIVFSLVVSAFCWVIVALTTSQITPWSIGGVPVKLELRAERLREMGLSVVGDVDTVVDVMVEGPRTVVGNLTPDDLSITISVSRVTEAGTYDLTLISDENPEEYDVISITPETVRLRLDQVVSDQFDVELVTRGISTPPDYLLDKEQVSPATVKVTGPASELERVRRCVATVELEDALTNSYATTVPLKLLDFQGQEIDLEEHYLTLDVQNANVWIPVLLIKEIPLSVTLMNVPKGLSEANLRQYMHLSNESIMVAGPIQSMANYNNIIFGYIDVHDILDTEKVFRYDITLPSEQFVNINNIRSVYVEFDTDSWSSVTFNGLSRITPINQPGGYEVTLLTSTLPPVVFVGDAATLEEMSADDIIIEMDLSEKQLIAGQGSYPVKISAPNKDMVWAVGEYSVIIQVSEI